MLVDCVFQGISSFHLGYIFVIIELVIIFLLMSMALAVMPLLHYDISNLCLLSFYYTSRGVSILFIISKNEILFLLIFSTDFLFLVSFISALILTIYFHLLTLDLICSSFSSFLRWMFRLLISDLSSFLIYAFSTVFLSKFDELCFHFHLVQSFFVLS